MTDSRQLLRTLTRTWLSFALQASSKNKPAIKVDLLAAPHGIPVLKHPLFVSVHYLFNPKNVFLCIPTVYGKKKSFSFFSHTISHLTVYPCLFLNKPCHKQWKGYPSCEEIHISRLQMTIIQCAGCKG